MHFLLYSQYGRYAVCNFNNLYRADIKLDFFL